MRRTTPHKRVGFAWFIGWATWKPCKVLRRGRIDERICWRYIELRRYLAKFGYLRAVPALIALIADLILDWIFITQHKPYLPGRRNVLYLHILKFS